MLRVEMEALQGMDFDIGLTGFDEKELAALFETDDEAKEDDFNVDAELEKPCISQAGDIWHLGKHRVICGDATVPETYRRLLGDTKVNLVCTDPPCMVNLESASGKIKNDNLSDKEAYDFIFNALSCFRESMAKDASIYKRRHGVVGPRRLTDMCVAFIETCRARGFGCGVYASLDWLENRLDTEKFKDAPIWCAQWETSECDWDGARIWQFTDGLEVDGKTYDGNFLLGV